MEAERTSETSVKSYQATRATSQKTVIFTLAALKTRIFKLQQKSDATQISLPAGSAAYSLQAKQSRRRTRSEMLTAR
jgi:hypothetical protein